MPKSCMLLAIVSKTAKVGWKITDRALAMEFFCRLAALAKAASELRAALALQAVQWPRVSRKAGHQDGYATWARCLLLPRRHGHRLFLHFYTPAVLRMGSQG